MLDATTQPEVPTTPTKTPGRATRSNPGAAPVEPQERKPVVIKYADGTVREDF